MPAPELPAGFTLVNQASSHDGSPARLWALQEGSSRVSVKEVDGFAIALEEHWLYEGQWVLTHQYELEGLSIPQEPFVSSLCAFM